jgi:hypothetical protein
VRVRPDTAGISDRSPEGNSVVPTAPDALVEEDRTREQLAIIRTAAAQAVRTAAFFPATFTDPVTDTPEHYKP